jgi:hypothetical protein
MLAIAAEKVNLAQDTYSSAQENYIDLLQNATNIVAEITSINRIIQAFGATVEHIIRNNVKDFVLQAVSARNLLIGNVSLLDVSRREFFRTSLTGQAYLSFLSSIASIYTQISITHVRKGLKLCDELSKSTDDPSAVATRMKALTNYSAEAQAAVRNLAERVGYGPTNIVV